MVDVVLMSFEMYKIIMYFDQGRHRRAKFAGVDL
jgi:hypothetical protein